MGLIECDEMLIDSVLTCATAVHKELGPGLLESVYEKALKIEFEEQKIQADFQMDIPVSYKGKSLGIGFRADVIVENQLLLELKSVDSISKVHLAQIITYLKLTGIKRGYILNFNTSLLKDGIKRVSI